MGTQPEVGSGTVSINLVFNIMLIRSSKKEYLPLLHGKESKTPHEPNEKAKSIVDIATGQSEGTISADRR